MTDIHSTAINSTNSGPYVTSDRTELAPLCSTHQEDKGLRMIITCFTVLTVLVSLALMTQIRHGYYQVTPHGSVVSDNKECSEAGVSVMRQGGSAVDAVISTLFCLSVVVPHLVGIGGGGYLMVYDQRERAVVGCLDFQPTVGSTHASVGVPGFVAGLYQAHKSFGKLPWATLLNASIEIAKSGFTPSASLLSAIPLVANNSDLTTLLNSRTNLPLATTLETIAHNGSDELYNGSLSHQMVEPGYVSATDLAQYQVVSGMCQELTIGQYHVAVVGSNSGGPLLVELLKKINMSVIEEEPILTVALSLKETKLASRGYNSGVNVAATDYRDIYVSAVSGLGSVLGSLVVTSGGYVMNNNNVFSSASLRDDGRSPSLASPIIVTEANSACGNRFITGSSDVRDAAQLLVEALLSVKTNTSLTSVSDSPRARVIGPLVLLEKEHLPQLSPQQLEVLRAANYTIGTSVLPYPSLNVIHKVGDIVTAVADARGGGSPASF